MALHCLVATTRAVPVIDRALREKGCTLRALDLLWRPALVVPNAPASGCFVVAVMVAVLGTAVSVIEHPLALCAAFHCRGALFAAHVLSSAYHAAMPVCWTAWCELFAAPDTGLGKVLAVFFTGQGYPSSLQLVSARRRHSPN